MHDNSKQPANGYITAGLWIISLAVITFFLLTGCSFSMELKKAAPPAVVEPPPKQSVMVCNPYVPPTLPELPLKPNIREKDLDNTEVVAAALLEYIDDNRKVVKQRDDLRQAAIDKQRASCRQVLVDNKTLPE